MPEITVFNLNTKLLIENKYLFYLQFFVVIFIATSTSFAQDQQLKRQYLGVLPSFLVEPYDTINALEVNVLPVLYGQRFGEQNEFEFQLRSIVNYRFFKEQSGLSQIGGSLVFNTYFLSIFSDDFWIKPQLGAFYTYAYNRLDTVHTMTLGIEPGVYMSLSEHFSISTNLQPGINYYPDAFSQEFASTTSGFKPHFGVIVHFGYNF